MTDYVTAARHDRKRKEKMTGRWVGMEQTKNDERQTDRQTETDRQRMENNPNMPWFKTFIPDFRPTSYGNLDENAEENDDKKPKPTRSLGRHRQI